MFFCHFLDKNEKKEDLLCLYFNIEKPAIQADICGKYGNLCDFLKIVYKVVETAEKAVQTAAFFYLFCVYLHIMACILHKRSLRMRPRHV